MEIGNPGNPAQSAANRTHSFGSGGDGYGAVADTLRISRNETTIAQYTAFLNAKATTDPYNLYNPGMASNIPTSRSFRAAGPRAASGAACPPRSASTPRPILRGQQHRVSRRQCP